jgi:hypothetical protein
MTAGQIIRWWELRRLLYNAVLLVIGLAAIAGMESLMNTVIPAGEDAVEPLALIVGGVFYGIGANLFYTLGWIVELYERKIDTEVARQHANLFFRIGLAFSCLLTTMPFWFGLVFWLAHKLSDH